ncbi:putative Dol-P-Glc:Glc(2)Man(9)GlcNAc(2)-PP-Dol alpha-1,2-glucosyltransferase [Leptidea sinapis]|uniref:putative Dol-P-Glc:Glc(2)Man(9)GlcNAc(2)-PP-Dol alpha-1,2-glucosyltransferase n=1 Tax=Leptidea sinapis TaxID=189913 RepID=UPI00212EDD8E|nr:putative Dol-P-Glc:Glc(2)Man(9)GlcNAc(2)-PP-Dol alpha-1,2-glucosyltransferase [Leptidea sinapis]
MGSRKFILVLCFITIIFFATSLQLFNEVYRKTNTVIDELFHIRQGKAFCEQNFTSWDPKITTLPGLYLVTSLYNSLGIACNTYNLRFINLIGSCINLLLFATLLKFTYGSVLSSQTQIVLQALNFAFLPPLYFFSFVYYTDTLSLMFLLLFTISCVVFKSKGLVFVFGLSSVMMRQTNVLWVAMVLGHKILDLLIRTSRVFGNQHLSGLHVGKHSLLAKDIDSSKLKRYYAIQDVFIALRYHLSTCFMTIFKFLTVSDAIMIVQNLLVLIFFSVFVYVNGSIVVGDKTAHQATIHLPQLFYFLLFYGVFGLPYVLTKLPTTLKLIYTNRIRVILFVIAILIIVHYNTLAHPYLLADNRHYTFYIWNRWFGRYVYAKYLLAPVYVFLLFSLYDNLKDQNCVSFLLPYSICLMLSLALQKLLDIRYFLVPYIILRLRFVKPSALLISVEFLWYLAINFATFYIFFTKEIKWTEFEESQRIIW